jgi:pimeloyl-ACP methyl ester carboxylesterase
MNRSELTPVAYWLWQRGVSSLLFEFRAHGHTKGGKSTIGWKEADDVAAAIAEARRRLPNARIVLIGSSMGAAACAFAAGNGARADALILDSCYSRLVSASFGWWRFLGGRVLSLLLGPTVLLAGPLARINPFKADVAHALRNTECPVLLLHGKCDDLATPAEAERNLAALGGRGELVWFDDCGHSEFRWEQPEFYYRTLEAFLLRNNLIESTNARDVAGVAILKG